MKPGGPTERALSAVRQADASPAVFSPPRRESEWKKEERFRISKQNSPLNQRLGDNAEAIENEIDPNRKAVLILSRRQLLRRLQELQDELNALDDTEQA